MISKLIQKEIRIIKREDRREQINTILSKYQNLKSISGIKSRKDKQLIASMTKADGTFETNRQNIADIFADFYEQLYARQKTSASKHDNHHDTYHNNNHGHEHNAIARADTRNMKAVIKKIT